MLMTKSKSTSDEASDELNPEPILYVIDDDDLVRSSLEDTFSSVGIPISTFSSGIDFFKSVNSDRPGCILLDMRMPGMSGNEVQEELAARSINLPVIVITGYADVESGVRAMKSGALDYITKPFSPQSILEKVQRAMKDSLIAFQESQDKTEIRERYESLTARELEVLDLMLNGDLNKQIAGKLDLSERTVEFHRKNMMTKMGAKTSLELVKFSLIAR